MRAVLSRLVAASAALLAGAAILLLGPAVPAHADTVFIEVNPSTILAGFQVALRGSCGANPNPAKATSQAFGTVTLNPEKGFLIGDATIPTDKKPAGYSVRLTCASGSTATTTLWVISASSRPTKGPNTGGGYLANHGGGGTALLVGGLAAVAAGGALAFWTARRRRDVQL
jgi:hypothetical protein